MCIHMMQCLSLDMILPIVYYGYEYGFGYDCVVSLPNFIFVFFII